MPRGPSFAVLVGLVAAILPPPRPFDAVLPDAPCAPLVADGVSSPWPAESFGSAGGAPRGAQPGDAASPPAPREHAPLPEPPADAAPRGVGTLTARVPGTAPIVSGVRLVEHLVRVTVRDGLARTEIEEEFHNDTERVLEGRYVFRVPSGAGVSRLALWVGRELVEAEVVERRRAHDIFDQIVEDTVRPRDPALLEWRAGSTLSLKLFPIPAKGSRRLVVAYDEVLEREGDRFVYRLPLSGQPLERFGFELDTDDEPLASSLPLDGSNHFRATALAARDVELSFPAPDAGVVAGQRPEGGEPGYVALRVPVPDVDGAPRRLDRVVVLDTSASQSAESLALARQHVDALLSSLEPSERFAVLACDSACDAYPERGLAEVRPGVLDEARAFARRLEPGGSSDVGGALVEAFARVERAEDAQVVYLGDGAATAGDRTAEGIAAQLRSLAIEPDLHLAAHGPQVDAAALHHLARKLLATTDRAGSPDALARSLRRAPLRVSSWELPEGLVDVYPGAAPVVRSGGELRLAARALPGFAGGVVRLHARRGARAVDLEARVGGIPSENPLAPRLWAEARLAELDADPTKVAEAVALSKRLHVLSRHTALLALESEQMFAEFAVARTQPRTRAAPDFARRPVVGWGVRRVRIGYTTVIGRLPAPSVQRILRFRLGAVRACYERALQRDPRLAGQLVLRFVIREDGFVASSHASGELALADRELAVCAARSLVGLEFPRPIDTQVVVEYPLTLSSDGSRPLRPATLWPELPVPPALPVVHVPYDGPAVRHAAGDERWREERTPGLTLARRALERDPAAPAHHERLVRQLLSSGRFDEALGAAERFASVDPDRASAREVLGYARASSGDARGAARALDAYVELAPGDARGRARAARAFAALGDHARACAHRRALGEACLAEAPSATRDPRRLEVTLQCERGPCPSAFVVTPSGSVASPHAPLEGPREGGQPGAVAVPDLFDGTYRVLLSGGQAGARGTLTVTALGLSRSVPFETREQPVTLVRTTVSGLGR